PNRGRGPSPRFASERAANSCELRNRDTGACPGKSLPRTFDAGWNPVFRQGHAQTKENWSASRFKPIGVRSGSMRAHPGGGGMASHLEALAGVGDLGPVDLEDRKVLVEIISHQQITAVRREHRRLGQAADVELLDLGQLLAVDAQHRDVALVAV